MNKLRSNLGDYILENKNTLIGIISVIILVLAAFYLTRPGETKPNTTSYYSETKIIPYITRSDDLTILVEYEWIDDVYRNEWDCQRITKKPQAKLLYSVKNDGELFDELIYLPVPDYIYPDQFQTKPKFTWIDRSFIVIQDQPLEKGAMETYEFKINLQAYNEVCNLKNEVDGYSNEIENRYLELKSMQLSTDRLNQIEEAYISFKLAKEDLDNSVEMMRTADPSTTIAIMDKINKFNIRQNVLLSQATLSNEYSLIETENKINKMEETISSSSIDQLKEDVEFIKTQIEEQMQEPSLEDLLQAYYNVPR